MKNWTWPIVVLILLAPASWHVSHVTLHKLDAEIDETHRASVEVALTAMEGRRAATTLNAALPGLIGGAQKDIDKTGKVLDTVNSTVKNLNKSQADLVAAARPALTGVTKTLESTRDTLAATRDALTATRDTVAGIQPVEVATTKVITDVDAQVNSPVLADAEKHSASAIAHTDGLLNDFQVRLHPILNPEPCKTRGCKAKRAAGEATSVGGFAQTVYYVLQLAKAVL